MFGNRRIPVIPLVAGVMALAAGVAVLVAAGTSPVTASADEDTAPGASYDVVATALEGCSCPMFCSCYYNSEPTGGHMCQFNNAYKFHDGSHWGDVDLSGAKVWFSGDLGGDFSDMTTDWVVITFDRSLTPEHRDAIAAWAGLVFPVEWGRMETREDDIAWENGDEVAVARMASGLAELHLERILDPDGEQAVVLNTPYWGAQSNDGFELAYSVHRFDGEPSFHHERRNGFVITFRNSGELPAEPAESPTD